MAVNMHIRENLPDDAIVFDNFAFDNSIIGISTDGRVVYSFDKMCEELMTDEGYTLEDAVQWIDYNTVRAIPYAGSNAPIIVEKLMI